MNHFIKPADVAQLFSCKDAIAAIQQNVDLVQKERDRLCKVLIRLTRKMKKHQEEQFLGVQQLAQAFENLSPVTLEMQPKTFSNLKGDVRRALAASGLFPDMTLERKAKPLNADWQTVMEVDPGIAKALSRVAHYCSDRGIAPSSVSDTVIEDALAHFKATSLRANQDQLRRQFTRYWMKLIALAPAEMGLKSVTIPASRRVYTRLKWDAFPVTLFADVQAYAAFCTQKRSLFDDLPGDAVSSGTMVGIVNRLNHSATLLVKEGRDPATIHLIADLVTPKAFKISVGKLFRENGDKATCYIHDVAWTLFKAAKYYVKVDGEALSELERIRQKVKRPAAQMTPKNKNRIDQFNDPRTFGALLRLPARLWREAKAEPKLNPKSLVKFQAALAIEIALNAPLRPQNIVGLCFDRHLQLFEDPNATSTIHIPAEEVKNRKEMLLPLPHALVLRLIQYRDEIAPLILRRQPREVFFTIAGKQKTVANYRDMIKTTMWRYLGVEFNPHCFRHLSGKKFLESNRGGYETVKQLLGHKRIQTTIDYYVGIDTKAAGLAHQELIEGLLANSQSTSVSERRGRHDKAA